MKVGRWVYLLDIAWVALLFWIMFDTFDITGDVGFFIQHGAIDHAILSYLMGIYLLIQGILIACIALIIFKIRENFWGDIK